MKKLLIPFTALLILSGCAEDNGEVFEERPTEVEAPEGELTPTEPPEDLADAEVVTIESLFAEEVEEGTAVTLSGTVEELTDDGAFPAFILTDGQQAFIRNMAQTPVELGQTVTVSGIYEGMAEENMPLVSVFTID
ncbi:MAG TPA: membrane lipoprotein lipid attachment site-containing protein [Planococcus sp. (in: firmicutes)]|nr:membrane lipoprotein lipid attachment site-containing protein [Planococcus sp. (in: firmicutes)]